MEEFHRNLPALRGGDPGRGVGGVTDSDLAGLGAQLYFWGRVAFLPVYALGLPVVRTLAWTVSLVGIVLVLLAALPGV